jgi:hypothetical protein
MSKLLFLDAAVIPETRAEDLSLLFSGFMSIGGVLAVLVAIGAAFNKETRAVVWGPFIRVFEVSAPLGGTIATAFCVCMGTVAAAGIVHGYVELYTGDYRVVSGDGVTYAEPSIFSERCGNPRSIGKPLDCSAALCETVDTISGRWVKVKRRDPAQLDCWANYG